MKIEELMAKQGKAVKNTKKGKSQKEFSLLSASEKWVLVEKVLRDLGYLK